MIAFSMETLDRHRDARALFLARKAGVLSTWSLEVEGFPFGSAVPFALDRQGRPILLVSEIAQHTKNIDGDPRVCLTILASGEDVQASARLSVLAKAVRLEDGEGLEDAAARYYRHYPSSRGYHQAHDFVFVRLDPVRLRWIGGFGDIRWIAPAEFLVANPFSAAQEAAIVGHMNDDHADTMLGYCRRLAGLDLAGEEVVQMAGIDAEGCDLLADGRLVRLSFAEPVKTPDEARERLVALAR